jgi:hypothetical protein
VVVLWVLTKTAMIDMPFASEVESDEITIFGSGIIRLHDHSALDLLGYPALPVLWAIMSQQSKDLLRWTTI